MRKRFLVIVSMVASIFAISMFLVAYSGVASSSGFNDGINYQDNVKVSVYHWQDHSANWGLVMDGWNPSCAVFCNGITYTFDTHNLITNGGHDWLNKRLHLSAGYGNNATNNVADYIALCQNGSTGCTTGADLNATLGGIGNVENRCGQAYGSSLAYTEITATDLKRVLATTITLPSASAGTVTDTIAVTFSSTNTYNNLQVACLENSVTLTGSGAGVLYAIASFSAVNLISGDTLTITWSVTYT